MATTARPFRMFLCLAATLAALAAAWPAVAAPAITVSPGMGRQGASLSVSASGLSSSTSYQLEYSGSSVVVVGTIASDLRGYARATRTLPALPVGKGRMQLRAPGSQLSPGRIVASTSFVALSPLTFTPSTTRIHAGQTLGYSVGNLTTGYLTILYEGRAVVGPVAVSKGSHAGKFVVPTDRPSPLPANADLRIVNSVGRTTVGTLDAILPVRAALLSPFRIGISKPPPTLVKPSQRFTVNGTFEVEENESAPDAVSLWYFGDNGEVFPLGAGEATIVDGQSQYGFDGAAGGTGSMTAGVVSSGRTAFVAETEKASGVRASIVQEPSNAAFDALPDDRWRLRVRVVKQGSNLPIAGAVVQFEGAPVAEPESDEGPATFTYTSAQHYVLHSTLASQLTRFRATDDQGCPLTLARQLTDSNGYATFEFTDEELRIAAPKRIPIHLNQTVTLGIQMVGIDASAQGYGFQFPSNHPTNAGDFLPHIYEVQFAGVGDGVPAGDTITFVDYYQDVVTGSGSRDYTYTLALPQIQPGVALYDTSITPWVAHIEAGPPAPDSGPFPPRNLSFGPINSKYGIPSTWIVSASTPYPNQVTVRTDPAISGTLSSAKLYLDLNRNGTPEFVSNFSSSSTALDCSINGLDSSLTWRASFPTIEQQRAGRISGYVEFIGQGSTNRAKQKISIDLRERDLSWLAAPAYGASQDVEFRAGGQIMVVDAVEDSPDAAVQLASDPGYDIGRLRNETENTRVVDVVVDTSGHMTVDAPLDGAHMEAGRAGDDTLLEPAAGVGFYEQYTLIDESFPLFYYVWGVPILAGIELGANFNILAELEIEGEFIVKQPSLEPSLTVTTTPQLDLGLNFYVDIDVLFDLVDGGVDLDAVFALDMPISVVDNVAGPPRPCFTASLLFSWHFEVFCLPLDFVCDAINDIEGEETLLSESTGSGCGSSQQALLADAKDVHGRATARLVSNHAVVAYSPSGAGFMAFTRDDSGGSAPRVLVARPTDGGTFDRSDDEFVLSSQPGIRSIDIAFHDEHLGVMVWAESADDYPTLAAKTPRARLARQRLMFATWDGERWSPKQQLTAPSGGEGGVDLAACPDGAAGCPAGGAVVAVWTRDMAGDITQHRTRVYSARYTPGSGWSSPAAVDASAAALLDSSPSVTWVGSQPLVVFVRSTSGAFADTDARRVAYRFIGGSAGVQVPTNLPGGVAWPSAVPNGSGFVIVHTHAHDPKSFVGNTQRVALASASFCLNGACAVQAQALTDPYGRPVFGERPAAVVEPNGEITVTMRGVGFGPNSRGDNTRPEDPIGMALHTGDLVAFQASPGRATIAPIALTNDGRGHFSPSVAFDPVLGQAVVASTLGAPLPAGLRAKYAKSGAKEPPARAKAVLAEPDLEVMGVATGVDLRIEDIIPVSEFVAGTQVQVRVAVRNVGTTYTASGNPWLFRLGWDAPYDAGGTLVGAGEVPATLRPGEVRLVSAIVTVPSSYKADEAHALFATLVRNASAVEDVYGENDTGELRFGGMPKPFGLDATAIPGANVVQLTWEPVPDPKGLLGGYRVWHHDGDGVWKHLGSSFEAGFIDLAPLDGVERSYRVTSYSKNAVESEASAVASATVVVPVEPPPGGGADALFADGYE